MYSRDKDTYFRNIILGNISEMLFVCITDYFKLSPKSWVNKKKN